MIFRVFKKKKTVNWSFHIFLATCLLLPLLAFQPNLRTASAHAHAALLSMASTEPDTLVKVIIQKTSPNAGVEATLPELGGRVTKDLSIINAFVAQVPARSIPVLA